MNAQHFMEIALALVAGMGMGMVLLLFVLWPIVEWIEDRSR